MSVGPSHLAFLAACALCLFAVATWDKARRSHDDGIDDIDDDDLDHLEPDSGRPLTSRSLRLALRHRSFLEILQVLLELLLLLARHVLRALKRTFLVRLDLGYVLGLRRAAEEPCGFLDECHYFKRLTRLKRLFLLVSSVLGTFLIVKLAVARLLRYAQLDKYSGVVSTVALACLFYNVYF